MLIGEILRRSATRAPDKIAVIGGDRQISYRALDAASDRAAGALAALGLAKGARAAILAPNVFEYPILYFGAARAGVILANLSTRATATDLAYMLRKTGVEVLFFWHDYAANVTQACRDVPGVRHLVAIGAGSPAGPGTMTFDGFMALGSGAPPAIALAETDPLSMTFTGGTTGFPKAVLSTHKARAATVATCVAEFGLAERDALIVATPMYHAAGLYVWFQTGIMLGCTCVLQAQWDPRFFADLVERHRATAVLLVPAQLAQLMNDPDFSASRLATLRHINYAGAPMPPALLDRLMAALPQVGFTENYGQSETGGPIAVRRPSHPPAVRGSVGLPAHNVETRIVDIDGNEVPPGVVGEIVTRGDNLLAGYWDEPEQTAALFKSGGGWLWTGDLGMRDENGFITLVDRSKDMIVSGAENIYPTELENALLKHPAVAECAAFGMPDDRWGEVPAAHVVLHPGTAVSEEDLIAFVADQIARFKRPRLIKLVEHLPKTAMGKVQRGVIRAVYWQGRGRRI
jgi:acyl-CoA synthetase (AMP-forming)/AMP-acid ligase II